MRIQDKVVVITGGASGLGRATAQYLLEEKGARVAILDLNATAGDKTIAELGSDRSQTRGRKSRGSPSQRHRIFPVRSCEREPCAETANQCRAVVR